MKARNAGLIPLLTTSALLLVGAGPSYGADVTTLSDGRVLVVESPAGTPRGVALLIPGSDTQLRISPEGAPTPSGNFVIRTRGLWVTAGFAIAYLNDPTDIREPIAQLRTIGRPIVVVSTSRGTIVAGQNAARLGSEGPDLLVLTSPVTSGEPSPGEIRPGISASLADVDLRAVAVPTLVVTNDRDRCRVSTPAAAAALARRFSPPAHVLHVASSAPTRAPCEALTPHGYLGIEAAVIGKIIDWIGTQPTALR